jgi:adenylate cyclase
VSTISRRDLRLVSGLVLFAYVTLHLTCHALGLVSLEAAETALRATVLLWHSVPGTVLLYGAAAVHVGLALHAVYERRTLRMPPLQALRIVLGLVMPIALIGHFVGTRYAFEHFGLPAEYARIAAGIWAAGGQGLALGLLAPGWLHGCLGLRFAFGSRRAWQRGRTVLFGIALLLPVLAALGFVTMGRELTGPDGAGRALAQPTATQGKALGAMRDDALDAYLAVIALVAALRLVRRFDERRRNAVIRIAYPNREVVVPRGWTVLEASRSHGIPHQSICGGRARCTTCRVRVVDGAAHCPPPGADEARTLERIGAPESQRLACQLRPTGDIAVEPLVAVAPTGWRQEPPRRPTAERELALLFFEVKGHGASRPDHSAHDVIYALDRFDAIVGKAIQASHGLPCRRTGDSTLALYGVDGDLEGAVRRAFETTRRIAERADQLAERLDRELGLDVEFTVGLHVGTVVVGTIGAGETRMVSAIGPGIDAVERLQQLALAAGLRQVVSRAALAAAGQDADAVEWRDARDDGGPPLHWADAGRLSGAPI